MVYAVMWSINHFGLFKFYNSIICHPYLGLRLFPRHSELVDSCPMPHLIHLHSIAVTRADGENKPSQVQ